MERADGAVLLRWVRGDAKGARAAGGLGDGGRAGLAGARAARHLGAPAAGPEIRPPMDGEASFDGRARRGSFPNITAQRRRMRYYVTVGDRVVEVDLTGHTPVVDGTPVEAELTALPGTPVRSLLVDGRSHTLSAKPGARRGQWSIALGKERFTAEAVDERTRAIREMAGTSGDDAADKTVTAPMPGLVVKIEVEVGQAVRAGQGVVVVEAMKMENELKAPADGVVAKILVQERQTVDKGAALIVLE